MQREGLSLAWGPDTLGLGSGSTVDLLGDLVSHFPSAPSVLSFANWGHYSLSCLPHTLNGKRVLQEL